MSHRRKHIESIKNKVHDSDIKREEKSSNFVNGILLLLSSIVVGYLNYAHVSYMQEHNVMFSHLSNLERELSFRTEMGFYYSFYKQVINAPDVSSMVNVLVRDNLTEYPNTINALQRFNVYPELVVGLLYRWFMAVSHDLGWQTRTCYMVNRGDLPAVQSCEGLGEPTIFYVHIVMVLNGIMMSFLWLLGYIVSGKSWMGAIVTCALYFFNHRECTRVQWTPPLRESFSFPCLIMQMFFLLNALGKTRQTKVSLTTKIGFITTTLASLLSWQFAQFALLTQCIAIFLAYLVAGNDNKRLIVRDLLIMLLIADFINLVLQFGNTLLITGPLRPCLIMACLLVVMEQRIPRFYRLQNTIWAPLRWIWMLLTLLISTAVLKHLISIILTIKSDDHMYDIFLSKFSNFTSFDSLLYTCAPEFDFYDISSLNELFSTGLLPLSIGSLFIILVFTIYKWLRFICSNVQLDQTDNYISASGFCQVMEYYLFFQVIAYIAMAAIIMRLKLFATPHLCIMAALFCHRQWPLARLSTALTNKIINPHKSSVLGSLGKRVNVWPIVLILAACSIKGTQNLLSEWRIQGSYSNWEQEQLMNYIAANSAATDAFTGQMATMATVRLVTGRPIVIHPHYEDEQLRKRVHWAYSVYSKQAISDVWMLLRSKLQAKYLVYEHAHCNSAARKPNCSYTEMWDIKDPINANRTKNCVLFDRYAFSMADGSLADPAGSIRRFFKWKFSTSDMNYSIFEILDVPQ